MKKWHQLKTKKLNRNILKPRMIFISTPFSRKAAERLKRMKVKAYKIGSGECNNIPLVRHIAKDGKTIILSTGMNDIQSVKETAKVLNEYEVPFALLHTTNLYPTPPHLVRLGAMEELMREFPNNVIGLSDHTLNNTACIAATTLGASILERHYTDVKTREGPDIVCSMDEEELRQLIAATNDIHIMRGGNKTLLEEEQITRDFAFATVVAIEDIQEGSKFTEENIWVKRPGTGDIPAADFAKLIGKRARNKINNGEHLKKIDIIE